MLSEMSLVTDDSTPQVLQIQKSADFVANRYLLMSPSSLIWIRSIPCPSDAYLQLCFLQKEHWQVLTESSSIGMLG